MKRTIFKTYILCKDSSYEELDHVQEQFSLKPEFDIVLLRDYDSRNGALMSVLKQAMEYDHDLIIVCEKFHDFPPTYKSNYLIKNITHANNMNANILLGGAIGFVDYVKINKSFYWIDFFSGTTFVVIFKRIYEKLLLSLKKHTSAPIEEIISKIDNNTLLMYPFISFPRNFWNSENKYIDFYHAQKKISILDYAYLKYGLTNLQK